MWPLGNPWRIGDTAVPLNGLRGDSRVMTDVHILTDGFETPNGRAFLFPVLRYRDRLRKEGIHVSVYEDYTPGLKDCDVLILDSKYYIDWWGGKEEELFEELASFADAVERVLWFDTSDSTGHLQTPVLDHVDGYYKNQLLADRREYTEPLYGQRLFTDYYHRRHDVTDRNESYLDPVEDRYLDKLHVSWNFGLADHSLLRPLVYRMSKRLPSWAFDKLPWDRYFGAPGYWTAPERERRTDLSARFGTTYDRETIEYQRELAETILSDYADTDFVGRWAYWRELRDSKLVVSPFGWGEPCYRDFEAFLAGCILVKPRMDHLETWPPVYEEGETMISVSWDLDDLGSTVESTLDDYEENRDIAERGQERYRRYLVGEEAGSAFVDRFSGIVGR